MSSRRLIDKVGACWRRALFWRCERAGKSATHLLNCSLHNNFVQEVALQRRMDCASKKRKTSISYTSIVHHLIGNAYNNASNIIQMSEQARKRRA